MLTKWIDELKKASKKATVVVEGKNDYKALALLGINSMQLHRTNKPLDSVFSDLEKTEECILLLDLDKQGRKLSSMLRNYLTRNGVRVNNNFRNFLQTRTRLRFIEGLPTYLTNLQKEYMNFKV